MKLSYEDIAQMFNMSIESVKYHIFKARKENKGEIKSNDRPFSLSDDQLHVLN